MSQQTSEARPRPMSITTRQPRSPAKLARGLSGYLFILPTFIFLGYFLYLPAWTALTGAFTIWDGFNPPQFVGLQNFQRAFGDATLRASIRNNVIWALLKIPLYVLPPFVVAELIFHTRNNRLQFLFRTLFVVPLVVPSIVEILLWKYFYRSDGMVNQILALIGFGGVQPAWLSDPDVALYALIFMNFPWVGAFNLLIFYAGLQGISTEVLESAAIDGASGLRRILRIDMPLVAPQFKLLLTLAVIGSVQVIVEPLVMTAGGPGYATYMPGLHMYYAATKYGEFGYSMAIAFLMFVVILLLTAINQRLIQQRT